MERNRVVVFGGTGFLGREIVRALVEAGMVARVAARRPAPPPGMRSDAVELCMADVQDERAVADAVRGAWAAVNAVSLYVEPRNGPTFDDIHVQGAERVARLSRDAGAERLVHISGVGASETSESGYVRSRGLGERRVREALPTTTILRPTVLFGPGDAFLSTLDGVTRAPVVPLFGKGETRLQPVHVQDIAAATARVLERPETAGQTFELGGAGIYSYREVVEMVLKHRRRHRLVVPMPFPAWKGIAGAAGLLPNPPLTTDQVMLLQMDNIAGHNAGRFDDLGIEPRDLRRDLADALD